MAVIGPAIVVFLWIGAAIGQCAQNEDGTGCEYYGLLRFLMFPGSAIVGMFLMIVVIYRMQKGKE
jgi:hypothetical protein